MGLAFRCAGLSDVGRVRTNNEDSAFASARLLVLADGVGGAVAGEVASAVAVQVVRRLDMPMDGPLTERLDTAMQSVRHLLRELSAADPTLRGMGTTLIGVLTDGEHCGLLHIGDSRAYLLRGEEMVQLTNDHTFVQGLVDGGHITVEEARVHPYKSMVTRAIDDSQTTPADLQDLPLQTGDRLLLCSDGLSDAVGHDRIAELLTVPEADKASFTLVNEALDSGSRDNVTVLVADVVHADDVGQPEGPMVLGAATETVALPWASASEVPSSLQWAAGLDVEPETITPDSTRRRWRFGRRS